MLKLDREKSVNLDGIIDNHIDKKNKAMLNFGPVNR